MTGSGVTAIPSMLSRDHPRSAHLFCSAKLAPEAETFPGYPVFRTRSRRSYFQAYVF